MQRKEKEQYVSISCWLRGKFNWKVVSRANWRRQWASALITSSARKLIKTSKSSVCDVLSSLYLYLPQLNFCPWMNMINGDGEFVIAKKCPNQRDWSHTHCITFDYRFWWKKQLMHPTLHPSVRNNDDDDDGVGTLWTSRQALFRQIN